MRRIPALLCLAGLATAPTSVVAAPSQTRSQKVESFEWSTAKGRLGVMVLGLTPELRKHFGAAEDRGVLVAHVDPRTPAADAGIEVGDVIVDVHGQKIDAATDVLTALSNVRKGERTKIAIVRDGKPLTLDATLSDDPAPNLMPWFRDWLRPFGGNRTFSSPFDESWFRDWPKPFEPRKEKSSTKASNWLERPHQTFAPKQDGGAAAQS